MKYEKPALSIEEQIALLRSRNLLIENDDEANIALSNISYYRLSSYLYPYRNFNDDTQSFYPGTNFNNILKIYSFDRKLRLLIFDSIERIEIGFRTQFIHQMALKYGAFWYNDVSLFSNKHQFSNIIDYFQKEYKISHEVFIEHYKSKYNEPEYPPAWMSIEIFTFGHLSRHYSNLNYFADKKMIARYFCISHAVFESWLHSISYVRNICAHHSRLWNRTLRVKPVFPKSNEILDMTKISNDKLYSIICIIMFLLSVVHPKNTFHKKLLTLLDDYPMINLAKMGFPKGWQDESLWRKK